MMRPACPTTTRRKTIKLSRLLSVSIAALLLFAACGSDDDGSDAGGGGPKEGSAGKEGSASGAGAATFTAVDFAFKGPASLPAGKTKLTMENEGKAPHMMILVQLLQGKTIEDAKAFIEKQGVAGRPPKWVKDVGEIRTTPPGKSQSASVDLQPGNYLALCFVESKGKSHVELGMIQPITVQ